MKGGTSGCGEETGGGVRVAREPWSDVKRLESGLFQPTKRSMSEDGRTNERSEREIRRK